MILRLLRRSKRALENRYKQIEQKIQELNEKVNQENRLLGESYVLARQIEQIEKSGHSEVLQNYRKRQQQLNEINTLEDNWQETEQPTWGIAECGRPSSFQFAVF